MNELGRLSLDRGDHLGMAVTGCHHGYSRIEVKKGIAVDILNQSAQAAPCNERITARVGWRDMPPILFDHPFSIGPGQRSDQVRQLCVNEGFSPKRSFGHRTIVHALRSYVGETSRQVRLN